MQENNRMTFILRVTVNTSVIHLQLLLFIMPLSGAANQSSLYIEKYVQ